MSFVIKRAYEPVSDDDGKRILVDRLWPRGVSKEKAHLDGWFKEVAPDTELRKWFKHDPDKFKEFTKKYDEELMKDPEKQALVQQLLDMGKEGKVTLVYSAKDEQDNDAVVLKAYLESKQ